MPDDGRDVQAHKRDGGVEERDMDRREPAPDVHCAGAGHGQGQNESVQTGMRCVRNPALPGCHAVRQLGCSMDKTGGEQRGREQQYGPAAPGVHLMQEHVERRRHVAAMARLMGAVDCICGRELRDAQAEQQPMRDFLQGGVLRGDGKSHCNRAPGASIRNDEGRHAAAQDRTETFRTLKFGRGCNDRPRPDAAQAPRSRWAGSGLQGAVRARAGLRAALPSATRWNLNRAIVASQVRSPEW